MKKTIAIIFSLFSFTAFADGLFFDLLSLSTEQVYEKVESSVYGISSGDRSGGAVAITEDVLVTNCHVLSHQDSIWINDELKLMQIINSKYKDIDICFIFIPDMNFKPVKIKPSSDVKIGESVYAVGNPEGYHKTISKGIISNKNVRKTGTFLQTDAAISHGSSGGGLFDNKGNLIGITSSIDPRGNAIAFAAPTEPIINTLDEIKKTPKDKFITTAKNFKYMVSIINRYYDNYDDVNLREELALCSSRNNYFCSGLLGEIYYGKKSYSLAYPLLLKSSGVSGSNADYYLGTMFKNGLGVTKNYDKAWIYFKKSALLGDSRAARDIGYAYINQLFIDEKNQSKLNKVRDNLINGYAWLKVSETLGEKTYTYDGEEGAISDLLHVLEIQLENKTSLTLANEKMNEICSKIDRCTK